ncbi:MAG: hypothetical protein AAF682_14850 [Planctomycetota bacterium]
MRALGLGLTLVLLLGGCSGPPVADLGRIYDHAARVDDRYRNPVIVIPGILGSRLVDADSGSTVWGAFAGDFADPGTAEGARLFALPMEEGRALHELRDGARPDGALDRLRVRFLGLPIVMDAYLHILAALGVGRYRDQLLGELGVVDYGEDHFTCFQFDYDWRRDLAENARALHAFVLEKKAYVEAELEARYGRADEVRFDLVAHSMGGLLARYYLRYGDAELTDDGPLPDVTWAGAEHVERAVLVAPPNAGSAQAVLDLTEGVSFGLLLPRYPPAVIGTLPSAYQLLPRPRHGAVREAGDAPRPVGDLFAPELWERYGWGLADPRQDRVLRRLLPEVRDKRERRRIALDHLAKCLRRAERVTAALDAPAPRPAGLELYLFAGDAASTPAVVEVDREGGALRVAESAPGDGTVLRSSALMDERVGQEWTPRMRSPIAWTQVVFLFTDHLGLTQDPAFTDNVLYLLLEEPR